MVCKTHTDHTGKLLGIACISKSRPSHIYLFRSKHKVTAREQEDEVACHSSNLLGLTMSNLHTRYENGPAIYDSIPLDHIMSPCTCIHNDEETDRKEINMCCSGFI